MSLLKKGRISDRNNVFDENISTSSTPSVLGSTTFNIPDYRGRFLRGVE